MNNHDAQRGCLALRRGIPKHATAATGSGIWRQCWRAREPVLRLRWSAGLQRSTGRFIGERRPRVGRVNWSGHHVDGSPSPCGVTILGVREGLVAEARLHGTGGGWWRRASKPSRTAVPAATGGASIVARSRKRFATSARYAAAQYSSWDTARAWPVAVAGRRRQAAAVDVPGSSGSRHERFLGSDSRPSLSSQVQYRRR